MAPIPKLPRLPTLNNAPLPATPALAARPTFPTTTLGPHLASAVTAVAARTQAPPELVAHHILTLAAMAAQRLISIRLPTGAQRPVSCFFVSLVGVDEGRGAAEKLIVDAARLWERAFEDEYPMRVLKHVDEGADTGVKRPAPLPHLNLFYDPLAFQREDRYRTYMRQSGFFARHPHDLIQPGAFRRAEAATLCGLWDGKVAKPALSSPVFPRLALHLVATPRAGRAVLGDAGLDEAGLLGRMLIAAPAPCIGARTFTAAENDDPPPDFEKLLAYLGELYEKPATTHARVIAFSPAAAARWLAFARETEEALASGGAFARIRAFAVHLPEHAARLAAVVAFMNDCGLEDLSEAHLENGIALARFYAEERASLLNLAPVLTPGEKEDLLREWLQRTHPDEVITLREMCRKGPPELRDADTLYKLMLRMEGEGIVHAADDSFQGANAPRRPRVRYAWRVGEGPSADVA